MQPFGSVVGSDLSHVGDSLAFDGKPFTFSIDAGTAVISSPRISFVGNKTAFIGIAFDRFNPSSPLPEPRTLVLLVLGAMAIHLRGTLS